jgi:hypothetical protein
MLILGWDVEGDTYLNVVNSGGRSDDGPPHHAGEDVIGEVGPGVSDLHKTLRQGNGVSVRDIKFAQRHASENRDRRK